MEQDPTYEKHVYHPTRPDGLDRNLRKINFADWENGVRCICGDCTERYQSSRVYAARVERWIKRYSA